MRKFTGALGATSEPENVKFRIVFDAIREMMNEKKKPKREIAFHIWIPNSAKIDGANPNRI